MQLSDTTIAILKNCSQLQSHILIEAGNTIRTVNSFKTTMLKCTVQETFENEVRLHNLNDFIRMLSLFDEPQFSFDKDQVLIYDENSSMVYGYSDREDLVVETRDPPEMEVFAEFQVTNEQLSKVTRAAQMNKVEDIGFFCDNSRISVKAHDKSRITREFKVSLDGHSDQDFVVYLKHGRKCAKLTLLPLDYTVAVGKLNGQVAVRFKFISDGVEISYLVAAEYGSYIGPDEQIPF